MSDVVIGCIVSVVVAVALSLGIQCITRKVAACRKRDAERREAQYARICEEEFFYRDLDRLARTGRSETDYTNCTPGTPGHRAAKRARDIYRRIADRIKADLSKPKDPQ